MDGEHWPRLPDPPAPPDLDVRHLTWRRHDVREAREGDLGMLPPEAFRAEIIARDVAWSQVPAGSLPEDDRVLAHLLGFGRDTRRWRRVRDAGALSGWRLCRDGRLWNLQLVSEAQRALTLAEAQRERTLKARMKAAEKRRASPSGSPVRGSVTELVTDTREETRRDGTWREGRDVERTEEEGWGGVGGKPRDGPGLKKAAPPGDDGAAGRDELPPRRAAPL